MHKARNEQNKMLRNRRSFIADEMRFVLKMNPINRFEPTIFFTSSHCQAQDTSQDNSK